MLEFYMLARDLAVLLTFDARAQLLVQYRLSLDRHRRRLECLLERRVHFDAPMAIRVGIGGVPEGYIVATGRTSRAEGDECRVRLLAADPLHCADFAEFRLDDEVGRRRPV